MGNNGIGSVLTSGVGVVYAHRCCGALSSLLKNDLTVYGGSDSVYPCKATILRYVGDVDYISDFSAGSIRKAVFPATKSGYVSMGMWGCGSDTFWSELTQLPQQLDIRNSFGFPAFTARKLQNLYSPAKSAICRSGGPVTDLLFKFFRNFRKNLKSAALCKCGYVYGEDRCW